MVPAWVWIAAAVALALLGLAFVTQPFVTPVPFASEGPDPARLKAHVARLSGAFHPRDHAHPANLRAAAAYIRDEFARTGAEVSEQAVAAGFVQAPNVIARFGPREGELLVIGAHYDVYGDTNPGADDNASGVAGLLELARLFAARPPPRPVELVAYPFEEPPFFRTAMMGSAVHARSLAQARRRVALMISLEMIGYFDERPGSQRYPLPGLGFVYPASGNFIAVVGRFSDWRAVRALKAAMLGAAALPVYSINIWTWVPGVDFSDHVNYWHHGLPAVMITDTAFYRNPHYHGPTDTPERLDYPRMARVVHGVFAFAQR